MNSGYNPDKQNYNIKVDETTFNHIDKYKQFKKYKSNSQSVAELVRAGLDYLKEQAEDEYLLALAEERLKNGSGKTYSFDEILAEHGITREELDSMEDVEIE